MKKGTWHTGEDKERNLTATHRTLWKLTDIKVLAFFKKNNNAPATYREIARAYTSASYSHFEKSCKKLLDFGTLEKIKDGLFIVHESDWSIVKTGKFSIEITIPRLSSCLKELKEKEQKRRGLI